MRCPRVLPKIQQILPDPTYGILHPWADLIDEYESNRHVSSVLFGHSCSFSPLVFRAWGVWLGSGEWFTLTATSGLKIRGDEIALRTFATYEDVGCGSEGNGRFGEVDGFQPITIVRVAPIWFLEETKFCSLESAAARSRGLRLDRLEVWPAFPPSLDTANTSPISVPAETLSPVTFVASKFVPSMEIPRCLWIWRRETLQ
ncbi:hypothetical protein EDB87DRAFT_1580468 [Lactarius vividus]|nr:hypothetical protein EDB87DRAFT_1580468 [Lactarius vividus]